MSSYSAIETDICSFLAYIYIISNSVLSQKVYFFDGGNE